MADHSLRSYTLEVFHIMRERRKRKKRPEENFIPEGFCGTIIACHERGVKATTCATRCEEMYRIEK